MKIAVLTQNDVHAIPANIDLLKNIPGIEICSVGVLSGPADVQKKGFLFLKGFGLGRKRVRSKIRSLIAALMKDKYEFLSFDEAISE